MEADSFGHSKTADYTVSVACKPYGLSASHMGRGRFTKCSLSHPSAVRPCRLAIYTALSPETTLAPWPALERNPAVSGHKVWNEWKQMLVNQRAAILHGRRNDYLSLAQNALMSLPHPCNSLWRQAIVNTFPQMGTWGRFSPTITKLEGSIHCFGPHYFFFCGFCLSPPLHLKSIAF